MELNAIRTGDRVQLKTIYKGYQAEFTSWLIKQYHCSQEEANEVYQIAVVALYENVVNRKLNTLTCSTKTYLFAIGRNKYLEQAKRKSRFIYEHPEAVNINIQDTEFTDSLLKENRIEVIEQALIKLGEPGRTILELYFYHRKSMKEIAKLLNYRNSATAKNLKYKALLRLKKIVKQEFENNEIKHYG